VKATPCAAQAARASSLLAGWVMVPVTMPPPCSPCQNDRAGPFFVGSFSTCQRCSNFDSCEPMVSS
jgi:hypothetical protein